MISPDDWTVRVNAAETPAELEAVRRSAQRGTPFGGEAWVVRAQPCARPRAHASSSRPPAQGSRAARGPASDGQKK